MAMSVTYTTIGGVIVHEALSGGGERELTADPLGSLVKIRTSAANYSYSAEYWPYGEIQAQTGSNPTRWAFVGLLGYMRDLATMFYVRARYYRSAQTRWMTVDPLWPIEASYSYTSAAPTMLADPLGLQAVYPNPPGGIGPPSPTPSIDFGSCYCTLMPTCDERYQCCKEDVGSFVDFAKIACGIFGGGAVACLGLCKKVGTKLPIACILCLLALGLSLICLYVAHALWKYKMDYCHRAYLMCKGIIPIPPPPSPPSPVPSGPSRTGGMLYE